YTPWVACRYQGDLYVGGIGLFKLDGNNWQLIDSSNIVNVLTVIDGKLLIGGWFTSPAHFLGQLSTSIVSYDGTKFENFHNIDTISNSVAVRSIIEYKGKIYVGGNFDPFPPYNTDRKEIVRWNGSNWEAVGQGIKGGGSDIVNSMA